MVVAVPSRIYFVVTLFALLVTLVSVPFTVAVLTCESRADPNLTGLPCGKFTLGARIFLSLASLFALTFTIMSWRALKAGARRDAAMRRERAQAAQANQEATAQQQARLRDNDASGPPPGYH